MVELIMTMIVIVVTGAEAPGARAGARRARRRGRRGGGPAAPAGPARHGVGRGPGGRRLDRHRGGAGHLEQQLAQGVCSALV